MARIQQEADGTLYGGISPTTGERMYIISLPLMTDQQLDVFQAQHGHSFGRRRDADARVNAEASRIDKLQGNDPASRGSATSLVGILAASDSITYTIKDALKEHTHMVVDDKAEHGWRHPDKAESKVLEQYGFMNLATETAKASVKGDRLGRIARFLRP